jgi:hypothetical protein
MEFDIDSIEFPTKFVNSASVAKNIVDGIHSSHEKYWGMIEQMEEHIEGKKPKDAKKLRDQGLSWSNNWNYGKARAKIERGTAENVKTVNDALTLSSVSFRRYDPEKDKDSAALQFLDNPDLRGIISTKIALTFSETFEREQRSTDFLNVIEYNSFAFGWCAVTKDKKRDWFGTPHKIRDIGFKDKTKPDEVKLYAVFDEIKGDELWRLWTKYRKSENKIVKSDPDGNSYHLTAGGYIIEGLEEALYFSYNGITDESRKDAQPQSFQEIVPDYARNSSLAITNTDKISIARIYNFEMDGTFTVSYIAYGNPWFYNESRKCKDTSERNGASPFCPKYMLYQKTYPASEKISQDDVIVIIKDSGFAPNGYIQDFRGIAKYAVEDSIRYNRKKNNIEDKLIFSGSPFFSQGTGQDGHAFRISPSQGFVITNDSFRLVDQQPRFDLNNHLVSLNMDEQHYERDTVHYDAKIGSGLTSRPNKDEVRLKQQELSKISGSKLDIKLRSYKRLFFNMLKSLSYLIGKKDEDISETAQKGVDFFTEELLYELKEYGVETKADLVSVLDSINDLSLDPIVGDADSIKEMLSLAETPYARRRLTRMLFTSRGLPRKELNRLYPVIVDDYRTYGGQRVAAIENDLFWTTKEVVYQENDDPVEHLDVHFNKIATVFEQINNGSVDPVKGYQYIANMLEHSLFHIEKLLRNPFFNRYFEEYKGIYDGFTKALNSLKPKIEKMAKEIAANMQQQQGQQNIDPKTQAKIEMDWFKARASAQLNKERSDFRAQEKVKEAEFRRNLQESDHEMKKRHQEEINNLKKEKELISASIKLGEALTQNQKTT